MGETLIKRCVIFTVTICVHTNNLCITGLCEPMSVHKSVVRIPDRPALLFAIAVALSIAESDLWPRRWPFRPMQKNLIFAIELLMALAINNLMLRIIWLPFVRSALKFINCYYSAALLWVSELILGRSRSGFVKRLAQAACSPSGVDLSATVLAVFILASVVMRLYGQRIMRILKCIKKCAAASTASERYVRPRRPPGACGYNPRDDLDHGDVGDDDDADDADDAPDDAPWERSPLLSHRLPPPPIVSRQVSRQSCTAADRSRRCERAK